MKKILFTLLAVLGFAVCYPALFILIGSLMGEGELQSNLSAIMNDQAGGYARWALLPEDPTWESYKALFLYEQMCIRDRNFLMKKMMNHKEVQNALSFTFRRYYT